jgi:hypothetical protein
MATKAKAKKTKAAPAVEAETTQAAIFGRLWGHWASLPAEVARYILEMKFPDADTARMRELAALNRERQLTEAEFAEWDNYLLVADELSILHSKARKRLGVKPGERSDRG